MRIQQLTPQQKQFAEAHHELVIRFLSGNNLDEAEFYDVVIFGYLHAVQDYLEKPELSRYQFSTIAWKQRKNSMNREFTYRCRPKRNAPVCKYQDEYAAMTLDEFLPDRMNCIAETLDNQKQLCKLLSYITPKEKEVVYMKAEGYTYREIAGFCDITIHGVSSRMTRMRQRLKMLALI